MNLSREGAVMSHHCRNAERRGRWVFGAAAAVGAVLAFGMTPLAPAPPANAEFGLEDLLDPNWFDPTTWTDIADQLFDPASSALGDPAGGAAASGTGLDDLLQQSSQWVDGLFGQSADSGGAGDDATTAGAAAAVSTDTGEAGSVAGSLYADDETVGTDALTSASVPL